MMVLVVCRKRSSSSSAVSGLGSMIRGPQVGAVLLRTIMDISVCALINWDRPRLDYLGHQCSHALG